MVWWNKLCIFVVVVALKVCVPVGVIQVMERLLFYRSVAYHLCESISTDQWCIISGFHRNSSVHILSTNILLLLLCACMREHTGARVYVVMCVRMCMRIYTYISVCLCICECVPVCMCAYA